MFRAYQEIADGFRAALWGVLDRLQELAAEVARTSQDGRMCARRGPQRAPDLENEERVKATVILSRELREDLRGEVLRRQKVGEKADVSSILREAARSYLEALAEEPNIVTAPASARLERAV